MFSLSSLSNFYLDSQISDEQPSVKSLLISVQISGHCVLKSGTQRRVLSYENEVETGDLKLMLFCYIMRFCIQKI